MVLSFSKGLGNSRCGHRRRISARLTPTLYLLYGAYIVFIFWCSRSQRVWFWFFLRVWDFGSMEQIQGRLLKLIQSLWCADWLFGEAALGSHIDTHARSEVVEGRHCLDAIGVLGNQCWLIRWGSMIFDLGNQEMHCDGERAYTSGSRAGNGVSRAAGTKPAPSRHQACTSGNRADNGGDPAGIDPAPGATEPAPAATEPASSRHRASVWNQF